jgi:hypothetical protein
MQRHPPAPLQGIRDTVSVGSTAFAPARLILSAFFHDLSRIHFRAAAVNEPKVLVA